MTIADEAPKPTGTLVAVGGNEDKEFALTVLRKIVSLPEGGTKIVEVIPTASSIPEEVGATYIAAFTKTGVPMVNVMNIQSRAQAKDPEFVRRIKECDVIFLTGGDQLRLTTLLGGSPVLQAIKGHYERGGVVAGTSAGAAAMSGTMIFEGEATAGSMVKGNVQMTPGLGLISSAVIDTHFIARGRFSRLFEVVTANPGHVGLGVGEDTAMVIRDGALVEVVGTGVVVVVDGHHLGYTNISDVNLGAPIAAENLIVHTLVEGGRYDLSEQRYIPPERAPKVEHANP